MPTMDGRARGDCFIMQLFNFFYGIEECPSNDVGKATYCNGGLLHTINIIVWFTKSGRIHNVAKDNYIKQIRDDHTMFNQQKI